MTADIFAASAFITIIGLAIGSFVRGSHCPACDTPIRWFDNIPVLSFIILRGRCRACGQPISARYPAVETLTGLVFLLVFLKTALGAADPWSPQALLSLTAYLWFAASLIAISFIDAERKIIPDKILITCVAVGLPLLLLGNPSLWSTMAIGAACGFGSLFLLFIVSPLVFGKQGMGFGDVKLGGVMGIFLGWPVLLALFAASLFGSLYGIAMMLAGNLKWRDHFAFGAFLALGALLTFLAGEPILNWYLSFFS
jgi:leader peptidase (prepilin peptidase)/N-methyltransferase